MDTMSAFAMGEANRHKELMVFDWDKAAAILKERNAQTAEAGLASDWEYTGGVILLDGKPLSKDESYTYLASTWATPQLEVDGDVIDCYVMQSNTEWDEKTFWPESALAIFNGGGEVTETDRWSNSALEPLIGKYIAEVRMLDDSCLYVLTGDGQCYEVSLHADCCSETWFYSIENINALIGHKVLQAVEVDESHVDVDDGLCRQDSDSVYSIGLQTQAGICSFIYRNSSNGYYGGWMSCRRLAIKDTNVGEVLSYDWHC